MISFILDLFFHEESPHADATSYGENKIVTFLSNKPVDKHIS